MLTFVEDVNSVNKHSESDLPHYIHNARSYVGQEVNLTSRDIQYPPLFSVFLIPALSLDVAVYVLFLNVILGCLTIIPLMLLTKRFVNYYIAVLISAFVVIVNIIFSIKSYGYPMVLSAFLFAWFIYFFYENRIKESSIVFMLMLMTKYVFFYLVPFIVVWMFLNNKKIMDYITFFSFGSVFFIIWTLRNYLFYSDPIGGYSSLGDNGAILGIYVEHIPSKFASIFNSLEPNVMVTYYMVFIVMFALIYLYTFKKRYCIFIEKYDKRTIDFHLLLIINALVFFLFPAMTYDRFYLNWRYLSYFTPVYLALSFVPIVLLLKSCRNS